MVMVDNRVGSAVLEPFINRLSVPTSLLELDYGDVAFEGNGPQGKIMVAIERKRVGDMIECISTGRFAGHQLGGLLSRYEQVYLFIEGFYRCGPDGSLEVYSRDAWRRINHQDRGYLYRNFDNYLTSLEADTGSKFRLRRSTTPFETAAMAVNLYHFWNKPWTAHHTTNVFHNDLSTGPLIRPGIVRRMAKELPLVGWERSGAVAKAFATPAEMVNAPLAAWLKLEGFGKTMAAKVYSAIWEGKV